MAHSFPLSYERRQIKWKGEQRKKLSLGVSSGIKGVFLNYGPTIVSLKK